MRWHVAFLVANHGPAVEPANGRNREDTPYAATVLEDDAVPVAVLCIYDGALADIAEVAEVGLQDHTLLIGTVDVIGAIADLATMVAWGEDMANHQQVVAPVVLHHTAAFKQSALVGLTLEELHMAAFDDIGEVGLQLHHLTCTIEDIHAVVVIKEERGIVEVAHAGVNLPGAFGTLGRADVGVGHRAPLVGREEGVELTLVILQRGGPLSAAIDGAFLQVVLGRVGETVEDIAHRGPVLQVLGLHHRGTRHQVHRRRYQIEGVADTDDIGVGNIGPQHGILDGGHVAIDGTIHGHSLALCAGR